MYNLLQHHKKNGLKLVETTGNYSLVDKNGNIIHPYTKDIVRDTIYQDADDYIKRMVK